MVDYNSRRQRRATNQRKIFLYSEIAKWGFFAFVACIILGIGLFFWFSRDLPTPGKLVSAPLGNSTHIYDRNNTLLYSVYQNENRSYVKLANIPKYLREGTVAIEDKTFYENQGFSIAGYLRAIRNMIFLKGIYGGSTITQQLVKNVLLQDSSRSLSRKAKELVLSIQVDKKYSKDQILEMYLNDVGYGGSAVGVEAAAETYFGKPVGQLDLAQSAMISGLPQNPNAYNPFSGYKYYITRTQEVLDQMQQQGYITKSQASAALSEIQHTTFSLQNSSIKAPYFIMYVKQVLSEQFGDQLVENGGLQVTTTLDYNIEKNAEDTVQKEIAGLKSYHVGNAAAMVMDPKTGEILAMVGGKDYFGKPEPAGCTPGVNCVFEPNVNLAIAQRQPGSSLKPVMYATAFEKGYTPATLIMDTKTDFPSGDPTNPTYTPVNYDGKYHGPVQVRFALGNSFNIPAVKMLAKVGIKPVMQQGYDMGISSWQPTQQNINAVGLSLVLGGKETTLLSEMTAYSVFANQGMRHDPVTILKVTDKNGNVLYQYKPQQGKQVLDPKVAFLISHVLLDNNARVTEFGQYSSLVVPGKTVSAKTGTTDEKKDNWTYGYTPSVVVGVWVGNDDNEPMNQALASGITGAAPIWNGIMKAVLKGKPDEPPKVPDGVEAMQIDALGGGLPKDGQPTRSEYFIKGTEPTAVSPIYLSKDGKNYIYFHEDDPVSTDGQNRWQAGIDAWVQQNHKDDPTYNPPADVLQSLGISPTSQPSATPTPGH